MTSPAEMTPGWHAARRPDAPAIVMAASGQVSTFAQLEERSRRFAGALRSRGLVTGDHIAILMENNRAYLEIAWAAQRSGLYYTAVNSHLRRGEVQYILDDCEAKALIASPAVTDVVAELDLAQIPIRVSVGEPPDVDGYEFETYDEVLRTAPLNVAEAELEGREMLYSSGTTGRPKGVRKTLSASPLGDPTSIPVLLAVGIADNGVDESSIYLSPAPLYHSAPLVYSMSMHRIGVTVIVMERFDPQQCLELIQRYGVTHAQFVPTMFTRMLRLAKDVRETYDVSSLQFAVHAAAPCPIAVKRQMIDWWGPVISEYYAGTEDIGSAHISAEEWLAHPGSVGRPREECHIVGPDGAELSAGQSGTIYFSGGRDFAYHNDPDKTASVVDERGWRTLGDIGYLDEDGYLYLTDRQAHMIISGGVNIYPQEAENCLASHPAVLDVAVIGVPDEEMGEAVKAVVQPVDPATAGPELGAALLDYCRAELATYKCPRSVDFVEQLPRDENGKLYKRRLREQYWQGHDSLVV